MNKKAFELSANFVVILILSIVVFVIGIYMVNRFFDFAQKEKLTWDEMTKQEIDAALDSGERVAIPRYQKTLTNGEFASFGVGILNVLQGGVRNFSVNVDFVLCDPATSCGNPNQWIKTVYDEDPPINFTIPIKNNEKKEFLVGFDVQGALKGTYIFNVKIEYDDAGAWKAYDTLHKLYIQVK